MPVFPREGCRSIVSETSPPNSLKIRINAQFPPRSLAKTQASKGEGTGIQRPEPNETKLKRSNWRLTMTALIKNFAKSESGAVTVDWVVLTAAIVGLGLAVMAVVSGGLEDLSGDIASEMSGMDAQSGFITQ
jgi:Flp pilus assembly pilin Flp